MSEEMCETCEKGTRETVGLRCADCGRDWSSEIEDYEDLRSCVALAVQRVILDALMRGEMPDDTAMIDGLIAALRSAGYRREATE